MQNLILVFAAFFSTERGIYSQKPKGGDPGKIGGANAPPTDTVLPRKRGLGRVFAAVVWPGGHTKRGASGLKIIPYLLLVFSFLLQPLTKQALILRLQSLDSGRIFLNLLICQDLAQISSLRINSELIQNLVGFWACFSFLSLSIWAYI